MSASLALRIDDAPKAATPKSAGRFADLDPDKLRGGYYTPIDLTRWLAAWAVRHAEDQILEPSCGDGAFLVAVTDRLLSLGAGPADISGQVQGVEIVASAAAGARAALRASLGVHAKGVVTAGDFFAWALAHAERRFDCVVGNPPFIRYQTFPEPSRTRAMDLMVREGLKPNKLTNIWVPFVVAAAASLREGGRMALVLPAELLQVTYAGQLRSFLTERFERIDVVACNELFFDNAEQEVVLVLADGALRDRSVEHDCRVALTEAATVNDVTLRRPADVIAKASPKVVEHGTEKWLKYFLTEKEITLMRKLRSQGVAVPLKQHASVDVGVVTGKNEFFVLTQSQVDELGISDYTVPLVSRAVQMRGASLNRKEWQALAAQGDRVHLLYLSGVRTRALPARLRRYIEDAEARGLHTGYKCSIRDPWYSVPSVWTPDAFFFRQIYDFPRLVLNEAQATSTDTIHRLKAANPRRVISNIYTHLTAASAEIEGRSYGGGVLELEPTEAEHMLMPAKLNGALAISEADKLIRAGRLTDVLQENDRLVLMEMGLSRSDCTMLRAIWTKMRDRRLARRRRPGRQAE